ncbi:ATP-binding cassette domain-containing protein [Williamsia sp. 1135]|uniref:ATP-binding cassette domain-containing protein n=1 Tax=Williamsia sp. 1135 TaxID=1889262 RepID=UPI001F0A3463|nr:ATP-binding cassette domain-containing protein [Williamsia sp. 1135]
METAGHSMGSISRSPGTIHGLLGPNGAGKSTAVRALTTLIDLDDGAATVAGRNVSTQSRAVRQRVGLIGQSPALDEVLGGRQNLVMFGRLFGLEKARARQRADELLEVFDLTDAATRAVANYSGGMRRRLDIAVGLILTPAVLFLDEPTTGLDPRARNEVWRTVREIAAAGTTVLLTTQYLDEADQLAATISVMNHGRVIAEGSPDLLKSRIGGDRVTVTVSQSTPLERATDLLSEALSARPTVVDADSRTLTFEIDTAAGGLFSVVRALDAAAIAPADLLVRRPTLDEVFLHLTDEGSTR